MANYCPSMDADRYFADDTVYCSACFADEDKFVECCTCGENLLCSQCHHCESCDRDIDFCILPEHYYQRQCCYCKKDMQWSEVDTFSDLMSGYPVSVHTGCKEAAKAQDQKDYDAYLKVIDEYKGF